MKFQVLMRNALQGCGRRGLDDDIAKRWVWRTPAADAMFDLLIMSISG
jgi:hypothetical protein